MNKIISLLLVALFVMVAIIPAINNRRVGPGMNLVMNIPKVQPVAITNSTLPAVKAPDLSGVSPVYNSFSLTNMTMPPTAYAWFRNYLPSNKINSMWNTISYNRTFQFLVDFFGAQNVTYGFNTFAPGINASQVIYSTTWGDYLWQYWNNNGSLTFEYIPPIANLPRLGGAPVPNPGWAGYGFDFPIQGGTREISLISSTITQPSVELSPQYVTGNPEGMAAWIALSPDYTGDGMIQSGYLYTQVGSTADLVYEILPGGLQFFYTGSGQVVTNAAGDDISVTIDYDGGTQFAISIYEINTGVGVNVLVSDSNTNTGYAITVVEAPYDALLGANDQIYEFINLQFISTSLNVAGNSGVTYVQNAYNAGTYYSYLLYGNINYPVNVVNSFTTNSNPANAYSTETWQNSYWNQ
ncbi:MAG: hypothetical protein JRM72_09090 [Nitrososphaerota archaeon]|jgi:hypothetical protein|nr:hypothetical protein [Nitrososphaerota archaeon]